MSGVPGKLADSHVSLGSVLAGQIGPKRWQSRQRSSGSFAEVIANGKVYVAYGSIDPMVQVPACIAIRTSDNKKAEQAEDDLRFEKIDRNTYDKLGNLRQKGENEYKRCFTQRAPKQASFAEATRQAQALLAELAPEEIAALAELSTMRRYEAGQRIISAGEPANSLFFLQSGMVSVKLPSGVRLASLGPGMEFGEMAIIETRRSADVWADTAVKCLELPLDSFADYRRLHPQIAMKIMRNLSALLARRLILANAKVDLLSAY